MTPDTIQTPVYLGDVRAVFDTGIIIPHLSSIKEMLTDAKPTDTGAQVCQVLLQLFFVSSIHVLGKTF